jgi:hypothetical protein
MGIWRKVDSDRSKDYSSMKRRLVLTLLSPEWKAYRRAKGGTWYEILDYSAGWNSQWWQQLHPHSDRDIVTIERYRDPAE